MNRTDFSDTATAPRLTVSEVVGHETHHAAKACGNLGHLEGSVRTNLSRNLAEELLRSGRVYGACLQAGVKGYEYRFEVYAFNESQLAEVYATQRAIALDELLKELLSSGVQHLTEAIGECEDLRDTYREKGASRVTNEVDGVKAREEALDLARDVHWFMRMQGSTDPGVRQCLDKARQFIEKHGGDNHER